MARVLVAAKFGDWDAPPFGSSELHQTVLPGIHMRTDKENNIQDREQERRVKNAIDREIDLLRARVFARSVRVLQMQQMKQVVLAAMAIVLGSVAGWAMVR